jgi:outer membrane protein assembly factor BamD (BamD/ComL family)
MIKYTLIACLTLTGLTAEQTRRLVATRPAASNYAAMRLLRTAEDLLLTGEKERAVRMLETVIERHPKTTAGLKAWLALGKHYLEQHKEGDAINSFRHHRSLEKPDQPLVGDARELFLESTYLTGVAYYQMRQYSKAFPILRKITNNYPNSVWSNQSYYYIGLCHFRQSNWKKAINALNLVGTFIDPESPSTEFFEAGQRFYVKIKDTDLPTLYRLGKKIDVDVKTSSGDAIRIVCLPLTSDAEVFIGSSVTEIGKAVPGDNVLQALGGDTITVTYTDDNTSTGEKDVARIAQVRVVSTGQIFFTLGTYEGRAPAAFIGQPCFIVTQDADLDTTEKADNLTVKLYSRYREYKEEETAAGGINLDALEEEEEETWVIRDEETLKLTELGEGDLIRSGRFSGSIKIEGTIRGRDADHDDGILSCQIDDEVLVVYLDDFHIRGESPTEISARLKVAGEIENRPRATQPFVPDPVLKARKHLVEGEAYLELGRIFQSMGLEEGAASKCNQGLDLINDIVRTSASIPSVLREKAFEVKWNLEITKNDFSSAMGTCHAFNRLFPESPLVDLALMGMGKAKFNSKEYKDAQGIFSRILRLGTSQVKGEAQFMIAQCIDQAAQENPNAQGAGEAAVAQYKLVAERHPESEFAGTALAKVIDYYVKTKDYSQADDLLEQVFKDYPDAPFLDKMLLKWTIVSFRMQQYQKAHDKCSQLIFEFPSSSYAKQAKKVLPKIEKKLKPKEEEE